MVVESSTNPAFVHQPLVSLGMLSTTDWDYRLEEVDIPFAGRLDIPSQWFEFVSGGMAPVQESMSKTLQVIRRSMSS